MSYYHLNSNRLLEKAKDRYHSGGGKEKAAKYYLNNREILKESAKNKNRSYLRRKITKKSIWKE